MDVAPISGVAVPVFTPLAGFASITSPELTLEITEFQEGNWLFKTKVIKNADVGTLTLKRGSSWSNSDFSRWANAALRGDTTLADKFGVVVGGPTPRRTLLLIHFLSRLPFSFGQTGTEPHDSMAKYGGGVLAAAAAASAGFAEGGAASGVASLAASGASFGVGKLLNDTPEFALRVPAKAWLLQGCLPQRYKVASDFDASSSSISIQDLEISVEFFEEISLTG
jgi:hypothetical protein